MKYTLLSSTAVRYFFPLNIAQKYKIAEDFFDEIAEICRKNPKLNFEKYFHVILELNKLITIPGNTKI